MSVTVTAVANPDSTPPSVLLTLTGSGSAALTRYVNGIVQGTVMTADGQPTTVNGATSFIDYAAPYGAQVSYQVNGAGALTDAVQINTDTPWLVDPFTPARSVPVSLRAGSFEQRTRATVRGVFQPIGRVRPLVVTSGARPSAESSIIVETTSDYEADHLELLLAYDSVLLLNVPASLGFGVPTDFISVGDVTEARPSDIGANPLRAWTLPFQVVDPPVAGTGTVWNPGGGAPGTGTGGGGGGQAGGGGSTGTRTWALAEAQVNGTWADAAAKWPTWATAEVG